MESFRNACNRYVGIMHSSGMREHQIAHGNEIASRWDAYLLCDICRHFASVMLHFASLISHNLRCIPAYTHLIPTGFSPIIINYMITKTTCISFPYFLLNLLNLLNLCEPSRGFWLKLRVWVGDLGEDFNDLGIIIYSMGVMWTFVWLILQCERKT